MDFLASEASLVQVAAPVEAFKLSQQIWQAMLECYLMEETVRWVEAEVALEED